MLSVHSAQYRALVATAAAGMCRRRDDPLLSLFHLVDASQADVPAEFALATSFPRRLLKRPHVAGPTLRGTGLTEAQEALFVELPQQPADAMEQ